MEEQITQLILLAFMLVVVVIGLIAIGRTRWLAWCVSGVRGMFAIIAVGISFAIGLYLFLLFVVQIPALQTQPQSVAVAPALISPTKIISPVAKSTPTMIPRATDTPALLQQGQSNVAIVQTVQPPATLTPFEANFATPSPTATEFQIDSNLPSFSTVDTSQRLDISQDKLRLFAIDHWNSVLLYRLYTTEDSDGEISSGVWSPLPGNRSILFSSNLWTFIAPKSSMLIFSQSAKLESKFIINEQLTTLLARTNPFYQVPSSAFSNLAVLMISDAIYSPDGQSIAASAREQDGNRCPIIMRPDGTGIRRLPNCEADDHPRYWSVDGKWIVAWSESSPAFYAYEANGTRRVPLAQLGKMMVYDERYFPWRQTDTPICKGVPSFWSCE
jgi:hypothetical protein